ncbi:MAG: 2-hydroxyacyl-CoA dehydratase family protein [candidate division Zixibacteria bacterium]|nr:2-hydroxyacyl-CoA dehydratase family protein [candidate division Zixibacteria bacterium]
MTEEKKVAIKKIQATGQMRKIMADYFYKLDGVSRDGSQKIAWCTSVGPAELLLSLGFLVYYPENHGAMLGATRMAADCIPVANAVGYSPDICSYLTSDVGAYIRKETPLSMAYKGIEGLPKPDVLVFNTNQCRDVQDWMGWYSRELQVPMMGISTFRNIGDISDDVLAGIVQQIKDLIPALEKISGNKFDIDKLREVMARSKRCSELWKAVLESNTSSPAPMSFFDATIHMGPAVVLRGSDIANDYYELLLKELEDRVANGVGAVEEEKFRLYWEGMPIWGKLRDLSEFFIGFNTAVIASSYCNSWVFEAFDPTDPFLSMARAYTEIFIVRDEDFKEKYIEDIVRRYKLDGILFHDSKTCPNNSNNRYGMPERLEKRLGIPTLTINGDLNDLRCYSEEQAKTNIEAFIEQLEAR